MKVKIVVRVLMNNEKSRTKSLKIAVAISGAESAALSGAEKDQVVVAGEGIDAVALARQLRKGVGHAELVSVGEDKEEDKPAADAAAKMEAAAPLGWSYTPPQYYNRYLVYDSRSNDPSCTIM